MSTQDLERLAERHPNATHPLESDLDAARNAEAARNEEAFNLARRVLDHTGYWLDEADAALTHLEEECFGHANKDNVLGSAIVRSSQEIANVFGFVAQTLERQTPEERRTTIEHYMEDIHEAQEMVNELYSRNLELEEEEEEGDTASGNSNNNNSHGNGRQQQQSVPNRASPTSTTNTNNNTSSSLGQHQGERSLQITEGQIMSAIQLFTTFLRDVEDTFRDIDQDEANEIADVMVTLAHNLIASLQNIHDSITPQDLLEAARKEHKRELFIANHQQVEEEQERQHVTSRSMGGGGPHIELLNEDGSVVGDPLSSGADGVTTSYSSTPTTTTTKSRDLPTSFHPAATAAAAPAAASGASPASSSSKAPPTGRRRRSKPAARIRVLWPPLQPALQSGVSMAREVASQQPVVAAGVSLVVWPAAVTTALVSTPLVLIDPFIQDFYNRQRTHNPFVVGAEQGLAQVYQSGRLYYLMTKLTLRQNWRLFQRQLKRHGGLKPFAMDVANYCFDRVTHPVDTAKDLWDATSRGVGAVWNIIQQVRSNHQENRPDINVQHAQALHS